MMFHDNRSPAVAMAKKITIRGYAVILLFVVLALFLAFFAGKCGIESKHLSSTNTISNYEVVWSPVIKRLKTKNFELFPEGKYDGPMLWGPGTEPKYPKQRGW